MKRRTRIAAFLMSVILLICSFEIGAAQLAALAADEQSAKFISEYAKPGEPLYVSYDTDVETKLVYNWYIDGEKIDWGKNYYTPAETDLEKLIKVEIWDSEKKLSEVSTFCSKLPVIYINTEDGKPVESKDDYIDAEISIQGNDKYNSSNTTLYSGKTEIKGHGNSTWRWFPKKAFKLKLDKKTDLFSMGKNKHWLLIANYIDESLMRNQASVEMAKILGAQYNDALWVDVVFNGECIGNYQLFEQTKIAGDRVDIFDWEDAAGEIAEAIRKKEDLSKDDEDELKDSLEKNLAWMTSGGVTYNSKTYKISDYYELPSSTNGGFLMEIDNNYDEISKFKTVRDLPVMFKNPEFINTNPEVFGYIQSYVQDFEDAVFSNDKCITKDGAKLSYTDLCDADSLVSYWLANELLQSEFGARSTYFSKDIDGPLVFGPIWDFDFSAGSINPWSGLNEKKWISQGKTWLTEVMEDPYFAVKVGELYRKSASELREMVTYGGTLETWYKEIYESAVKNNTLWPYAIGFEEDYSAFKTWLTARLDWIDRQFENDETTMESMGVRMSDDFSLTLLGSNSLQVGSGDGDYSTDSIVSTGSASYIVNPAEVSHFKVDVNATDSQCSAFNYYINGKYVGSKNFEQAAFFDIDAASLNADGQGNVVTVWLLDANGQPVSMQSFVLRLTNPDSYLSVRFDDNSAISERIVAPASAVILPKPETSDNLIFVGWVNGNKYFPAGEKVVINENKTFSTVYSACVGNEIIHDFYETESAYLCKNCAKKKAKEVSYITAKDFSISMTSSQKYNRSYTGEPIIPKMTVSYNGLTLEQGTDYTVEYHNNINPGYATYTITGVNSAGYDDSVTLSFRILPRNISSAKLSADKKEYIATGSEIKPVYTLTYGGNVLSEGTDYTIEFSNNIKAGTGKAVIKGIGNFGGERTVEFKIKNLPTVASAVLSKTSYAYDGKVKTPSVTVKNTDGKILKQGTDYTVSYASGRKKVGKYSVKLTFKGDYKGSKTLSFTIVPGKTTSVKVASQTTNSITLKWSKTPGATGYRVYTYNTKTKKYSRVATTTKTTYTVKKLKAGQKYVYAVKPYAKVGSLTYWGTISSNLTALTKPLSTKVSLKQKNSKVTVSFKKVSGASGYEIYYKTSSGSYKKLTTTTKTSYTKTLSKGKFYSFKVRAYVSASGAKTYGAYSAAKSIRVK